jgi:hypothetical protein
MRGNGNLSPPAVGDTCPPASGGWGITKRLGAAAGREGSLGAATRGWLRLQR